MINMGADVNERAAGKPLLYWALRGELCCDVKILLDHGADRALALEALQEEDDRDYLGSLMDPPKKHQPSSPTELPWSLRRWLDAGASPSRLHQALERACENFPEGARWRNSSTMALLEAQALREHANSSKASAGVGGPRL